MTPIRPLSVTWPLMSRASGSAAGLRAVPVRDQAAGARRPASGAVAAANQELLRGYWRSAARSCAPAEREGLGAKVIDRLAVTLRAAFQCSYVAESEVHARVRCGISPTADLCKAALHEARRTTTSRCWTSSTTPCCAPGTAPAPLSTGWSRDVLVYHRVPTAPNTKAAHWRTRPRAPPTNPTSRRACPRPRTCSSRSGATSVPPRPMSSAAWSPRSSTPCWRWATGSRSSRIAQRRPRGRERDLYLDLLLYELRLRCCDVIELKVEPSGPSMSASSASTWPPSTTSSRPTPTTPRSG